MAEIVSIVLIGITMVFCVLWQVFLQEEDEIDGHYRLVIPASLCGIFVLGFFVYTLIKIIFDNKSIGSKDLEVFFDMLIISSIVMAKSYFAPIYIGLTTSVFIYFLINYGEFSYLPFLGPFVEEILSAYGGFLFQAYIVFTLAGAFFISIAGVSR